MGLIDIIVASLTVYQRGKLYTKQKGQHRRWPIEQNKTTCLLRMMYSGSCEGDPQLPLHHHPEGCSILRWLRGLPCWRSFLSCLIPHLTIVST